MFSGEGGLHPRDEQEPLFPRVGTDVLAVGHSAEVVGHADHRVGNEVRGVAGDGEHEIVVVRVHLVDMAAHALPERPQPSDGVRVRPGRRHDQQPAVVEQLGEPGTGAGMLGPGDRMRGHEVHALGDMGANRLDHRALDRTHVGHRRPGLQVRRDLGGNRPHYAHRHGQHHEIGAPDSLGRGLGHLVNEVDLFGDLPCLC